MCRPQSTTARRPHLTVMLRLLMHGPITASRLRARGPRNVRSQQFSDAELTRTCRVARHQVRLRPPSDPRPNRNEVTAYAGNACDSKQQVLALSMEVDMASAEEEPVACRVPHVGSRASGYADVVSYRTRPKPILVSRRAQPATSSRWSLCSTAPFAEPPSRKVVRTTPSTPHPRSRDPS
jgi:hypothetical protein